MAVLWQHQDQDHFYEVRSAGKSIRLYLDGVLHSQHNPHQFFSGSVWDLLGLACLSVPPRQEPMKVLVLGVGGGAIFHQILKLFPNAAITGVELSKRNIEIGLRFFDLNKPGIRIQQGDGRRFVEAYQDTPFDLIIDDMFSNQEGDPVRVAELTLKWFRQLRACLHPSGTIALNFADRDEFLGSPLDLVAKARALGIKSLQSWSTPSCANRVIWTHFSQPPAHSLRQQLASWPSLDCQRLKAVRRRLY